MKRIPEEKMSIIQTKYFVVSLPRTGTKSMCSMMNTLGISFKHAPSVSFLKLFNENSIRCFADTPMYVPSVIKDLVKNETHKFIYIDRNPYEWKDSFERVNLHNNYNNLLTITDENKLNCAMKMDRDSLGEVFNFKPYNTELGIEYFYSHKIKIVDIIPENRLLMYDFSLGWEPLCEFLEKDIPNEQIPHLNKNEMFENIT